MPDVGSSYDAAGPSSRSPLDGTVMDIDPPEDGDGKNENKQVNVLSRYRFYMHETFHSSKCTVVRRMEEAYICNLKQQK